MPVIELKEPVKYAHKGFNIVRYERGVQSVPDDVYKWAIDNNKGTPVDTGEKKMRSPVEENKSMGSVGKKRRTRGHTGTRAQSYSESS